MLEQLRNEFLNPSEEYSPIPFWFWNGDLKKDEIIRQIQDFKDKGIDGFVIHPRIGIPDHITYLSDEFMELVKCAVNEAAELGMKVVLYDEGMYPSGSAHGMVVQSNPRYASRGLKMIEHRSCSGLELLDLQRTIGLIELGAGEELVAALAFPKMEVSSNSSNPLLDPENCLVLYPEGQEPAIQAGILKENMQWVVYLFVEAYTKGHIRGIHFGEDDGEPGAPPSADLLNPEAMKQFIHFTHDRYYQCLKEYFGSTIIGMFTDEPAIMGRGGLRGLIPWTNGFLEWYLRRDGSIRDLPALWMDSESTQEIRRQYRRAVQELLELSYYQPISQWCEEHGIALMGHPEASNDIGILKHFHVPGQDVVWRWVAPENGTALEGVHSTQAKCSSDAARHRGRRRNSNECFGCCGPNGMHWAFTVDDMKWYMDWLFVRGVNMLIPHAFFYSIEGERRLDERPPDVGLNNLWWPYYHIISKYIKRISWLMTDSVNVTPVAVLCEANHLPWEAAKPLFENQVEFNYLEEDLLIENAVIENGAIHIRNQKYSVLIIEGNRALRPILIKKLHDFINTGGTILLYNTNLYDTGLKGVRIIECPSDLVQALEDAIVRDVRLDQPCESLRLSHVVKGGVHFYLLVNEGENLIHNAITIGITGYVELWDGWSGEVKQALRSWKKNGMSIPFYLERRQSLIIVVDPDLQEGNNADKEAMIMDASSREPNLLVSDEQEHTVLQAMDSGWALYNGKELLYSDLRLCSWTELPDMKDFSGAVTYECSFMLELKGLVDRTIYLNLGNVYNLAEVKMNGKPAGIRLWKPYIFDITSHIQNGYNKLEIVIINTLANRISKAELRSGLIGPVQIML
jgi:hypothetical protein